MRMRPAWQVSALVALVLGPVVLVPSVGASGPSCGSAWSVQGPHLWNAEAFVVGPNAEIVIDSSCDGGPADTAYSVNGGPVHAYEHPFSPALPSGPFTLTTYAVHATEGLVLTRVSELIMDATPPELTIHAPLPGMVYAPDPRPGSAFVAWPHVDAEARGVSVCILFCPLDFEAVDAGVAESGHYDVWLGDRLVGEGVAGDDHRVTLTFSAVLTEELDRELPLRLVIFDELGNAIEDERTVLFPSPPGYALWLPPTSGP